MAVLESIKTRATSLACVIMKRIPDWRGNGISLQQAMEKVPATELVEQ